MPSRTPVALVLLAVLSCPLAACGGSSGGAADGGACPAVQACGDVCCAGVEICVEGACAATTACESDDDCQGDRHCDLETGLCVPYGEGEFDEACTNVEILGVFAPAVQCEWPGPPVGDPHPQHANVLGTPMVADLHLDGDPAVVRPSIVFVSYNGEDGGAAACAGSDPALFGVIRVIDGATCAQQLSIAAPTAIAASPLALADLDLAPDGRPEIVAHVTGGGVAAFRYQDGVGFAPMWQSEAVGGPVCLWSGPAIHDLDGVGSPEVLMGGSVFAGATGATLDSTHGLAYAVNGQIPVAADLDGDGAPELATGDAVYAWSATGGTSGLGGWIATATGLGSPGLVAVADFGTYGADPGADDRAALDGVAEVVVVQGGVVRVQTIAGRVVFGPIPLRFFAPAADAGSGGPPTVADFDGDGRAEISVAGRGGLNVFDLDCVGNPVLGTCPTGATDGILWATYTQDYSSSVTGSAVFDFEGDGQAEVVYADECFSRVYGGAGGEILHSAFRSSCTWYENPVVVDVDGDFNTEIVIPSNTNCAEAVTCPTLDPQFDGVRCLDDADCPGTTTCGFDDPADAQGRCRCTADEQCGGDGYVCRDRVAGPAPAGMVCRAGHPGTRVAGVRVVRDALDRWVNSRPVWNQHAYAVTNVGDDGRCPLATSWARNWVQPGLNNFRQNIAGDPESDPSPDLTGQDDAYACGVDGAILTANVCNRGTEPVAPGVPVSFYLGEPAPGAALCTGATVTVLEPGACEPVSCTWTSPPAQPVDVTVVADDDGSGLSTSTECHEGNNRATITGVACDGPVE